MEDEAEAPKIWYRSVQNQIDILVQWSKDLDAPLQKLVGNRAEDFLRKIQKHALRNAKYCPHV